MAGWFDLQDRRMRLFWAIDQAHGRGTFLHELVDDLYSSLAHEMDNRGTETRRGRQVSRLRGWVIRMKLSMQAMGSLNDLMGCRPDAPLPSLMHEMMELLTVQVALNCGVPVQCLVDWWRVYEFGDKPREVEAPDGQKTQIRGIEELLDWELGTG